MFTECLLYANIVLGSMLYLDWKIEQTQLHALWSLWERKNAAITHMEKNVNYSLKQIKVTDKAGFCGNLVFTELIVK